MMSWWCHEMYMNGKVNQGPLFDINVRCNRSLKTKLLLMIVRQYSHLNTTFSIGEKYVVRLHWMQPSDLEDSAYNTKKHPYWRFAARADPPKSELLHTGKLTWSV